MRTKNLWDAVDADRKNTCSGELNVELWCLGAWGVSNSRVLGKRVEVEPSFFFLQDELSLSLFPFINYFG